MITYDDIRKYVEMGYTPEQIVEALNADGRHYRNAFITSADPNNQASFKIILSDRWRLVYKSGGTWVGPLVDYFTDNADVLPEDLIIGFNLFLTNLDQPNSIVYCGDEISGPEAGAWVSALADICEGLVEFPDQVDPAVASLTGGPKYGDVTVEDVNQVIADEDAIVASGSRGAENYSAFTAKLPETLGPLNHLLDRTNAVNSFKVDYEATATADQLAANASSLDYQTDEQWAKEMPLYKKLFDVLASIQGTTRNDLLESLKE